MECLDVRVSCLLTVQAITLAMKQYASTVAALYDAEVSPDKLALTYHFNNGPANGADGSTSPPVASTPTGGVNANAAKFAGKASGWLSKGQQAVKGLEKKTARVDGFVMPPAVRPLSDSFPPLRSIQTHANEVGMRQISQHVGSGSSAGRAWRQAPHGHVQLPHAKFTRHGLA